MFQKVRLRWVYYCCVRCKMAPRMVDLRRSLVLGPVLGLVLEPAQAFLASQDVQYLEYAGRRRPSGQRRPQRLGDRTELETIFLGKGAQRGFRIGRAPSLDILQRGMKLADQLAVLGRQQC